MHYPCTFKSSSDLAWRRSGISLLSSCSPDSVSRVLHMSEPSLGDKACFIPLDKERNNKCNVFQLHTHTWPESRLLTTPAATRETAQISPRECKCMQPYMNLSATRVPAWQVPPRPHMVKAMLLVTSFPLSM